MVVDLGISNVRSVINMLHRVGTAATAQEKPQISSANRLIILPGVGTFDEGMLGLIKTGWDSALKDIFETGSSMVLGLCLGMQLLTNGSEEGSRDGLGLIPGHFQKFRVGTENKTMKVPHMGWNEVRFNERALEFMSTVPINSKYYFVHSYQYVHENDNHVVGTTLYGEEFASAICAKKALGLQFHPEKSHRYGAELFSNLLERTVA